MNTTNLVNSYEDKKQKTSSLSVSLKPRKVNKGISLYLRLGYNGEETFISTGETCKESDIKNGKIKVTELNALIILILKIGCVFLSLFYELWNSNNRKSRILN
jgi:hypothetical protein